MKNIFGTQGPPGWLVTGAMAGIALVYVLFVFLPTQKGMKASRSQLAEKQKYIADSNGLFTKVSAIHAESEQAIAFVNKWRQDAPSAQQIDRLPAQLSMQASLARVRILRLEPQTAKPRGLVVEYPILISIEGSFEGIFTFFKGLEELPQTIWLQDVKLHRPSESGSTLRCELTLTILGDLAEKSD